MNFSMRIWSYLLKKSLMKNFIFVQRITASLLTEMCYNVRRLTHDFRNEPILQKLTGERFEQRTATH